MVVHHVSDARGRGQSRGLQHSDHTTRRAPLPCRQCDDGRKASDLQRRRAQADGRGWLAACAARWVCSWGRGGGGGGGALPANARGRRIASVVTSTGSSATGKRLGHFPSLTICDARCTFWNS